MKGFCLKVFLGCDDHTLKLRLLGRLELGQCLASRGWWHAYTLSTG